MAGKNDNQAVEAVRKTARFAANDVSHGHRPLLAIRFRGENAIVVSVQVFGSTGRQHGVPSFSNGM